jgi:hypothetical protein
LQPSSEWKLPTHGIVLEDHTRALAKYLEAKSIFYPTHTSASSPWQPVEIIYDPENTGTESVERTAEALTGMAAQGKTVLLWASDTNRGKTGVPDRRCARGGSLGTEACHERK